MKTAVGVMAQAPLPGQCKTNLLAAHSAPWVTGLYAAMLRDTLDGLQSVTADDYVVFVEPAPEAFELLARHAPAPWELVTQEGADFGARAEHAVATLFERGASYVLLSVADAPSFPVELLAEALANEERRSDVVVGPCEDGGCYVIGMPRLVPQLLKDVPWGTPAVMEMVRLRCKEQSLSLHELPKWYDVDEPSDVLLLLEEMRKHPDRAPRTAQFLVTST